MSSNEQQTTESRRQRLSRFAKEHPGTALMAAAGASAFLGGEFALGAVLGVGTALLVAKRSGAETRRALETKTREFFGSTQGWPKKLTPRHKEAPPPPPTGP